MKKMIFAYTVYKLDRNHMEGIQCSDELSFVVRGLNGKELIEKGEEKLREIKGKWEKRDKDYYLDNVRFSDPMEDEE